MEAKRTEYVTRLSDKRGNGLVKIITGVRRCGKSYLLFTLFKRFLLENGTGEDHIIDLALDDYGNRKYLAPDELYQYVKSRIVDSGHYYILLDEIQLVKDFESVLNGFLHLQNVDIYVTGSNSKFLSSDIITEFRGRGDQIRVYPFSFADVYGLVGEDKSEVWSDYARYGGMPLAVLSRSAEEKEAYLKNLFKQVYMSDIISRYKIRETEELGEIIDYLASSIGSLTNPLRLSNTFLSEKHMKVAPFTIGKYFDYLEDSFLISRARRYDIKGRKYIGSPMKYYFTDIGLRNSRLGFRQQEESHIMENVIYTELLKRGFSVDVGMVPVQEMQDGKQIRKRLEVDFVANKGSKRYYIQSALEISTREKMQQEQHSFLNIPDSFRRVLIQKNSGRPWYNDNGILVLDLYDFLLNPESIDF